MAGRLRGLLAGALVAAGVSAGTVASAAPSSAAPFTCNSNLYYTAQVNSSLFARQPDGTEVTTSTGGFAPATIAIAPDGRMFAFTSATATRNHLYTIASDGTVTDLGAISGLPNVFVGGAGFGPDGSLYIVLALGSQVFKVDVSTVTATSFPTTGPAVHAGDFVYLDGALYANNAGSNAIQRINLTTGVVTSIPLTGQTGPTANDALWSFGGHLYGESPQGFPSAKSDLFEILDFNTAAATSVKVGEVPRHLSDGASCASAPSPFLDAADDDFTATPVDVTTAASVGKVFTNDTRDGAAFTPAQVSASITNDGGATGAALATDGTLTVPAGTLAGSYTLTYKICRTDNTSICDPATVAFVVAALPALALTKSATLVDTNANGKADKGETINYSFKVDNTGNVDVTGVTIADALVPTTTPASADVAAHGTATLTGSYVVTQADVDAGNVHNDATASGSWLDGRITKTVTSGTSSADVGAVAAAPGLSIVKTATLHDTVVADGKATLGEKISYSFVVTNTGNVTLTNVSVADPKVTGITPGSVTLAPGASQTFTGDDYTVTAADMLDPVLVNTATASGAPVRGAVVTSAPSTARTPTSGPGGPGGPGGPPCDSGIDRVGGADRYATAAMLSARTFAAGAPVVYVASGQNFPDALGGGVAAGHAGAPLLLVTKTSVPAATAAELTRLAPHRIVVLGQTSAVGASVASALQGFTSGSVTRIGGLDRYETAALLAKADYPNGAKTAYLASGEVFADALSGGPSAILADAPMLLTQDDQVPATTTAALKSLGVTKVVVLGGPDAVSTGAAAGLPGAVTRIAGADRYATSVAIAEYTFPGLAAKPTCSTVYLATGEDFADALTGGPVAAGVPGPVLLTPTAALDTKTGDEIAHYPARKAVVLGGTNAVSSTTATQAAAKLAP